jgi:hypothetical protein
MYMLGANLLESLFVLSFNHQNPQLGLIALTIPLSQIDGKGRALHRLITQKGHWVKLDFSQTPPVSQRPYTVGKEFFNQIPAAAQPGCTPKGLFIFIFFLHFKLWKRHITVRAKDGLGKSRHPFDILRRHIKQKITLVTPLILGTWNNFNYFGLHISSPQRECARPKLDNQSANLLLPVQTIILGGDLNRRFPTIRSHHPDILRQRHHSVRRQLMNLNFKLLQHFHHKSMCRQVKSSSKKCLKHNQLNLRLRDIRSPRCPPNSIPKIPQMLHLVYAARVNPRCPKLHSMTGLQLDNHYRITNCILR